MLLLIVVKHILSDKKYRQLSHIIRKKTDNILQIKYVNTILVLIRYYEENADMY